MTIATGLGETSLRTKDIAGGPTAQNLFPYPTFKFELAQDAGIEEALAYKAGKHQSEEIFESTLKTTLKLSTEIPNWQMIGLSLGQIKRTFTSFTFPVAKRATVPVTGPFEIVDTDLTATASAKTVVAIARQGSWGQAGALTRVATAPAASGEVQVLSAGTKLVFHSSQAGASIVYVIDKTVPTVDAYGGPGQLAKVGELEFFGEVYDNSSDGKGGVIWIPRIQRETRPTIDFSGGKVTLETEFRCLTVDGWDEPFTWLDGKSFT